MARSPLTYCQIYCCVFCKERETDRQTDRQTEIERAYAMGLSGIPQNLNHLLCTFCRSQRLLTDLLAATKLAQRVCHISLYPKKRKKKIVELFITHTYNKSSWYGSSSEYKMTTKPPVFGDSFLHCAAKCTQEISMPASSRFFSAASTQ